MPAERLKEGDRRLIQPEAELLQRGVISAMPGEPDQHHTVGRRRLRRHLCHVHCRDGLPADKCYVSELLLEVSEVVVHLRDFLFAPSQVLDAAAGNVVSVVISRDGSAVATVTSGTTWTDAAAGTVCGCPGSTDVELVDLRRPQFGPLVSFRARRRTASGLPGQHETGRRAGSQERPSV